MTAHDIILQLHSYCKENRLDPCEVPVVVMIGRCDEREIKDIAIVFETTEQEFSIELRVEETE
jgi:Icc-related predicted phosphoesterase